jgi:hypothetical protein
MKKCAPEREQYPVSQCLEDCRSLGKFKGWLTSRLEQSSGTRARFPASRPPHCCLRARQQPQQSRQRETPTGTRSYRSPKLVPTSRSKVKQERARQHCKRIISETQGRQGLSTPVRAIDSDAENTHGSPAAHSALVLRGREPLKRNHVYVLARGLHEHGGLIESGRELWLPENPVASPMSRKIPGRRWRAKLSKYRYCYLGETLPLWKPPPIAKVSLPARCSADSFRNTSLGSLNPGRRNRNCSRIRPNAESVNPAFW